MLILSYADALGFNLHQLGQRVHQSSADGDGTTHRHVIVRELLAGNLRCRVDRGSVFAHHEHLKLAVITLVGHEGFGLTAGCTVTDGDGLYLVLLYQLGELAGGEAMFAFWGMRIDGLIVQQVALCVETNHLASRAIPRVDAHYPFLSQRRSQE